jgi:hypothetical protein
MFSKVKKLIKKNVYYIRPIDYFEEKKRDLKSFILHVTHNVIICIMWAVPLRCAGNKFGYIDFFETNK